MTYEKEQLLDTIISKYNKQKDAGMIIGESREKRGKKEDRGELRAMYPHSFGDYDMTENSPMVEELRKNGFEVIYPNIPNLEGRSDLSPEDKKSLEFRLNMEKNNPMIIDANETPSISLACEIMKQYFKLNPTPSNSNHLDNPLCCGLVGVGKNGENPTAHYSLCGTDKNYTESVDVILGKLGKLGYEIECGEYGNIDIKTNVPAPVVKKSIYKDISDSFGYLAKNAYDKIKSIMNPNKNRVKAKHNEQDEI